MFFAVSSTDGVFVVSMEEGSVLHMFADYIPSVFSVPFSLSSIGVFSCYDC